MSPAIRASAWCWKTSCGVRVVVDTASSSGRLAIDPRARERPAARPAVRDDPAHAAPGHCHARRRRLRQPLGSARAAGPLARAVANRSVDQQRDPVADGPRVDELQALLVARLAEQALALPEHDREHHEAQLVDEVLLDQALHELGAAVHDAVAAGALAQLRDSGREVALEHRRVGPLGAVHRRRHDVLRHAVELVGELAATRRPRVGEALVGPPPEQQRLRLERLVELEAVALLAAGDLERPAAVLEALRAARVLHDAVERHELGHHDLSHGLSSLVVSVPWHVYNQASALSSVHLNSMAVDELSATFAALADPTRRAILERLVEGEATVTELARPFPITVQAVSQHLRVLERAGLIERGRSAQLRPSRLRGAHLREAAAWLDGYRDFWDTSFDALDRRVRPGDTPAPDG